MIRYAEGRVVAIHERRVSLEIVEVETDLKDHDRRQVMHFPKLWRSLQIGDRVLLNINAVSLDLGTGGYDFVVSLLDEDMSFYSNRTLTGHILKMRYTPLQLSVQAEELMLPETVWNYPLEQSLAGRTVFILPLHSALPLVVQCLKSNHPKSRIVYIMNDWAALPVWISRHVERLSALGMLDAVITAGQAFGGTYEAINLYSALYMAHRVFTFDWIILAPGPGNVGTGTPLGHSGMNLLDAMHAVFALGGVPALLPRMSLAETRLRQRGLSHHLLHVLRLLLRPVEIVLPEDARDRPYHETYRHFRNKIMQLWRDPPLRRHNLNFTTMMALEEVRSHLQALYPVHSMGRRYTDDPLYTDAILTACRYWQDKVFSDRS